MQNLVRQIRSEMTAGERAPEWLVIAIAACVTLIPLALLGDGLADVFVSVGAALFLARALVVRDASSLREPWFLVAGVLWLYMIVIGLLSIDPSDSGLKALLWIRFVVFAAAIHFVLSRSPTAQRALLYAFIVMAAFGAADALFQFFVGFDVFGRPLAEKGTRLTGPLNNPSIGQLLFVAGLPVIFCALGRIRNEWQAGAVPIVPAALIAIIFSAIILSGERMIALQSLGVLGLLIIFVIRPPVRVLLALGLSGAIAIAGLLTAFPQIRERHLSTVRVLSDASSSIYGKAILSGVEVVRDYPVFGVGLKNFKDHCPDAVEDVSVEEACRLIHPHQVWLHIAAETGLVGTLLFLTLFGFGLWPALQRWRTWPVEPLLAGATLAVLLRLAPFTTSGNFFSNWREAMFWSLFGIAAGMARIHQSQTAISEDPAATVVASAPDTHPIGPRTLPS